MAQRPPAHRVQPITHDPAGAQMRYEDLHVLSSLSRPPARLFATGPAGRQRCGPDVFTPLCRCCSRLPVQFLMCYVRHAATQPHACPHPQPALSIPRGPALGFVPSCTPRDIAVPTFELPQQCGDNRDASGIAGTDTAHTRGATPARRTGWKAAAEATAAVKTAARVNIVACVGAVHCLLGIGNSSGGVQNHGNRTKLWSQHHKNKTKQQNRADQPLSRAGCGWSVRWPWRCC